MHYSYVSDSQLAHDLPIWPPNCSFYLLTCLDSKPFHFASKSVEFWDVSLYRWSLKNKLNLDLSCYIWKA